MRDIAFFAVFLVLLVFAFRKNFIALGLWTWSGLIVPKYWLYGFASSISYNSTFSLITLMLYVISKNKQRIYLTSLLVFLVFFSIHVSATTFLTIGFTEIVNAEWIKFFKGILMLVMILLIVRSRLHFNFLLACILLSTGFIGVVEGLKYIMSIGEHHIKGPDSHILSDNNHFALAICMVIPLVLYFLKQDFSKLIKVTLLGVFLLLVLTVLGTQSRGGFIGLSFLFFLLWAGSKKKLQFAFYIAIIATIALALVSNSWQERMNTIENADQDSSFMTRVVAWKMYTLMAMERPVLGAGFRALQAREVWQSVEGDFDKLSFIPTPPPSDKGWAAHSIYFQVLGDHGFVGLFFFLMILVSSIFSLRNVMKKAKDIEDLYWQYSLASMLQISLLVFCLGGAALSLPYAEFFWIFIAIVLALECSHRDALKKRNLSDEAV
ncbi:putative O-glycosylation ligase, exosortase A system-associated [Photobacterium sanctipauli]|uniref:Putative O-glycosylation ligase, exosortase A system-associated n=1 Tax=Photobacterium sanctipauli TaxID=1342794 RepID=A0A2T3NY64_9GAMM|nr:putative O-glycosylation ligase, exosortase A system-associated [Photobacterium sanctipauli]PSW21206.1 putative O-glycosylation ligase, exosortase A system-associated [Photobacterium sanctipauli]